MPNSTRQTRTLDRLTLLLADKRDDLQRLQAQTFEYILVPPSDEHLRISRELYNLKVNMGAILESECPF